MVINSLEMVNVFQKKVTKFDEVKFKPKNIN